MREIVDLVGKTGVKQLAVDQVRIEDLLPYAAKTSTTPCACASPWRRSCASSTCGTCSPTWRCRWCRCWRAWRQIGIALDVSVLREMSLGLNEQIEYPRSAGVPGGGPRVQPRLAAAALAGAVRGAGPAEDAQDQAGLLDRRAGIEGAARRARHRRDHPAVARAHQAALDLHRDAARRGRPTRRPHPHHLRPGRRRDGASLVEQPEPAEHPGAQRAGRPGAARLRRPRHRRRPGAALGRLLADRAAHPGAHVAGPGPARGVPQRRGHPRRHRVAGLRRRRSKT